ncbi:nitrate reductase subunit beta [Sciscionella sediminilitoris]|uniref:nitrate reductase subunit beta n=1 Tax=Sciscionella sediminilitoris TaxID=1445613 RepID=UPI0004DF5560|nr:nitrate reductase subunit beta [Sciscionella sp. SE31]
MKPMAQLAMVMNLDKCIGCHTCSVTCKQTWTNRAGTEYVWFNNVETRPGQGYPRRYEDQRRWRGGWRLDRRGRLRPASGGRLRKLANLFANPDLPALDDYYQPWTYDYSMLTTAPLGEDSPTAAPRSSVTGAPMSVQAGPNWDDDLGGAPENGHLDPVIGKLREQVGSRIAFEFEQAFMFYLPRICEHCLNPSCVASCPSGALYKRIEDGIVLVDQQRCRGWRMCVSGCPYKKIYFNHQTGKAEKCTFCYPRIEAGQPTICSETCVGRLRYIGVVLYDAERITEAASVPDPQGLYPAQLEVLLDPKDPEVVQAAGEAGIPADWITAAQHSPVYALIAEHRVALPLHPEYRTLPMVWYIPPLSPVTDAVAETGFDGEHTGNLFGAIDALRIPVEYLAELFTAGDPDPVRRSLRTLAAMRGHMRSVNLGETPDTEPLRELGYGEDRIRALHRLLALAPYEERYVIPSAGAGQAHDLEAIATTCSLDTEGGPGMAPVSDVDLASWKPGERPAGLFPTLPPR